MKSNAVMDARPGLQDVENGVYATVCRFLAHEASLLDQELMREWMDLLHDDFTYRIPIRVDRERQAGGNHDFSPDSYRISDTKGAMKIRIDRLYTGHAWAEEVASRTCRVVGSINVTATDDPKVVRARSAVILYRQRAQNLDWEIVPARHDDLVVFGDAGPLLLSRVVYTAENSLSTTNLAVII